MVELVIVLMECAYSLRPADVFLHRRRSRPCYPAGYRYPLHGSLEWRAGCCGKDVPESGGLGLREQSVLGQPPVDLLNIRTR